MAIPPVTRDVLFRAVLALDVFNRGYNSPVLWTPDATTPGIPTSLGIGLATLGSSSTDLFPRAQSEEIGFFAQAYTLANGQTVISYRGTDQPLRDRDDRYASSAASTMATVKRPDNGAQPLDRPTAD